MEGDGMPRVVLFMALKMSFSTLFSRRFTSSGGFSMYLGNGAKKPYSPFLFSFVSFHLLSWGKHLNLVSWKYRWVRKEVQCV